jgi:hypothetical protein
MFISVYCNGQDTTTTCASDPLYPMMDSPITIYVNVTSDEVLNPGNTIDTDSVVTAYTGLITSESSEPVNDWKNKINDDWNDISLEMTKENDSVYSYTISDPSAFYGLGTETKSVYRIAFIARGTSNGAVSGQTKNLYFEIFESSPTALIAVQPADPYATESAVISVNTKQSTGLVDYSDTLYAHTGLITSGSSSDTDWRFILEDWGVNNNKTRLLQVSDSIYRYYIYPNMHNYYETEEAENIEKLAFVFRSKEDPYSQTSNQYVDVTDTLTITEPNFVEDPYEFSVISAMVFPNPVTDVIYVRLHAVEQMEVNFKILNVLGKTIYESDYYVSSEKTLRINLNKIPEIFNGMFLYVIETDGFIQSGKLIIAD